MRNLTNYAEHIREQIEGTPFELGSQLVDMMWSIEPDLERARQLIAAGADLENNHSYSMTPLMVAVRNGNINAVKLLIKAGANVNAKSSPEESTPLMYASQRDWIDIMRMLLKAGAEIEATDSYGQTALHYAVLERNEEAMEFLLSAGANPNAANEDEVTPLADLTDTLSPNEKSRTMARRLIEFGANPTLAFDDSEQMSRFFFNETDWMPRKAIRQMGMRGMLGQ